MPGKDMNGHIGPFCAAGSIFVEDLDPVLVEKNSKQTLHNTKPL